MSQKIIDTVSHYYSGKITQYGRTPQGVDWNGHESQELRFQQLSKVFESCKKQHFSVLDFGCGFGAYKEFLLKNRISCEYYGFDISPEMISNAKLNSDSHTNWMSEIPVDFKTDFVIASGVFNVRLNHKIEEWEKHIFETLHKINDAASLGFSFNVLTSYSDTEFVKDYLYYASPENFFAYCKQNFSKQISLLHDYGLYEFTILVKK
jgi:SAM-dependent methyltransferase